MVSWHPLGIKAEHALFFQPPDRGNGGCRISTLSNALCTQMLNAHLDQVKRCKLPTRTSLALSARKLEQQRLQEEFL